MGQLKEIILTFDAVDMGDGKKQAINIRQSLDEVKAPVKAQSKRKIFKRQNNNNNTRRESKN